MEILYSPDKHLTIFHTSTLCNHLIFAHLLSSSDNYLTPYVTLPKNHFTVSKPLILAEICLTILHHIISFDNFLTIYPTGKLNSRTILYAADFIRHLKTVKMWLSITHHLSSSDNLSTTQLSSDNYLRILHHFPLLDNYQIFLKYLQFWHKLLTTSQGGAYQHVFMKTLTTKFCQDRKS